MNDSLAIRYTYPTGVLLAPPEQSGIGKRGAVVKYQIRLTNRSGSPDSFELAVSPDSDWPTTLSISQTGTLADGESIFFDAFVEVPAAAAIGAVGQSTVEAVSTSQPTVRNTALLNTTAHSGEIAYITLSENRLMLVDTVLYTVLDIIDLGASGCNAPTNVAITPDGSQVYVSCSSSHNIVVIDTDDYHIAAVLPVISPLDIAFTSDGSYALISVADAYRITTINTQTLTQGAINIPWEANRITVHPYLPRAYVAGRYFKSSLQVVDTTTLTLSQPIQFSKGIYDVTVSADGRYLFVAQMDNQMTVIDALDHSVVTVVYGLNALSRLEVAPDGSAVYGTGSSSVYVLDGNTFEHTATIWIPNQAYSLATTCDGESLWAIGGYNTIGSVIDTGNNQVVHQINLPSANAYNVAICPQHVVEDLLLLPSVQSQAGAPGETVTHELRLINATGAVDSYTLSLGVSNWATSLSSSVVGPLTSGQMVTIQVQVTIPASAAWYDSDSVQVTATGVSAPSFSASASLTTMADASPIIGVAPMALSSTQLAGQIVEQNLLISNGNGVTLTVAISDFDLTPDHASLPQILAENVYTTTVDNEDNALSGHPDYDMDTTICAYYSNAPVEFNIFADHLLAPTGNVLTVRASTYYSGSEANQVKLNGVTLGDLPNAPYQWTETSFDIPPGVVVPGANLVQVIVGDGSCFEVDWSELRLTGTPATWLQQSPSSASVPTNSSQNIIVTFDSTSVQPGDYQAVIVLESNDSVRPYLTVPVTMTVQPTADMGRVTGAISDAWTGQPLAATVELVGVHTLTPRTNYQVWAPAGAYDLVVSASGYVTVTTPVLITAGGLTVQDVALEPAQARLEWLPFTVQANVAPGGQTAQTLVISNTGPLPLDLALFEINLDIAEQPLALEDLTGRRILYDRSHGQPHPDEFSALIADAVAAGAVVDVNWYFPVNASVLDDYDILWSNCCGSMTWGLSELQAVESWMRRGGAVLVHGSSNFATTGLASIFDIFYIDDNCSGGTTSNISPHPISVGVNSVYLNYACSRLSPSPGSTVVVSDQTGSPRVVAKEYNGGKMVVFGAVALDNWSISQADNHVLGINSLIWLARPSYSDVPWLTVSPTSAVVSGHSSLPVTLFFDATGLSIGLYRARLAIEHNDPGQVSPAEVPVTLAVGVPTAVDLEQFSTARLPTSAPLSSLPLGALPAAAMAALSLAGWRSRRR